MSSRRSSTSQSPATGGKPARKARKQVVLDEELQVEAVQRATADPLPLRAGEWQGGSAADMLGAAAVGAASSASAAVELVGASAAQAARAEGGSAGLSYSPPAAKKSKKSGKRKLLEDLPGFQDLAAGGRV